jgi:hypothetical protein
MTAPQPRLSISNPAAYRENLFRLLGERDPLDVLAETPSALLRITHEHSPSALRARPFPDKWTPNEIIGHLADGEWTYGYRLRLMLCEDDPALVGTRQDAWVARQRHNERESSDLVETFAALRQLNLTLWKRLSPEELRRVGRHNERGPESLGVMLRMMAGHDLSHLDQLHRYLQATRQHA